MRAVLPPPISHLLLCAPLQVITGTDALMALYDAVGMGWAAKLATLPVVEQIIEVLYEVGGVPLIILNGSLSHSLRLPSHAMVWW